MNASMMTDLNASMVTDNMNIMTSLYSTIREIELVEVLAVVSIHWCTCEVSSFKIMFLDPYSVRKPLYTKRDISLAQWPA